MGLASGTGRLTRLVSLIAVGGLLMQAAVSALVQGRGPVASVHLPDLIHDGAALVVVLLLLTIVGDLVAVHVRRGGENEELTLFEVAVLIDILLLPAQQALLVPVLASILGSIFRRRSVLKVVFNAGNLGAATAVLVAMAQLTASADGRMTPLLVLGLALGTLAFTAINLTALALVLAVLEDEDPRVVIRQGARMSILVAIGTVGMASTAVVLASAAPALLPFSFTPAVALTFAYRAAAKESLERERAEVLLSLSHVLAGQLDAKDLLASFLRLARAAFGAEMALAVLNPTAVPGAVSPMTMVDDDVTAHPLRTASSIEMRLLVAAQSGTGMVSDNLPIGWDRALLAPLEADGRRLGALMLIARTRPGWTRRYWAQHQLGSSELVLLTPLASALASALRGVAHLQRLTAETSKLQAVIDQSSDGILVLDGDSLVQIWSPALAAISGLDEAAALGRPLDAVLVAAMPGGQSVDPFLLGRAQEGAGAARTTVELVLNRRDGELRVVRWAHAAVHEGPPGEQRLVRVVVIVHDVTRERQVDRLKADFIATVSHELRTPITPIKGYADLLLQRSEQMTPAKRADCLTMISERADHLARLVEDLLLASRISDTSSTVTRVDLVDGDLVALVRRACADPGEEGRRLRLHLPDAPLPVSLDPLRALQVVTNLVGNARKFSAAGTPVDVTVRRDGDQAVVEVVDVGRGIPADQLERIFEKFHRVEDPMTMTTNGTGLGLYIARDLAGAMGGALACTSTLGTGSTFTFTLPLLTRPTPPAALGPSAADPAPYHPPAGGPPGRRPPPPWAATPPAKPPVARA